MPLRALVNGVEVTAPSLSEAQWEALRDAGGQVILPCCGGEGYLRRSALGTLHFAHKRAADCEAEGGETIHHLKAKADIVIACHRAGYDALTEVAGGDWRADVLASRGSVRIAFEVQWSFLRLEDAVYRQERYAHDGVRGCWFFRNPPQQWMRGDALKGDLKAQQDLPLFHLFSNADHTFSLALNGTLRGLGEVVEALLSGKIRFCETAQASEQQILEIVPFTVRCPACAQPTYVYHVGTTLTARCGTTFKTHPLEFRREVLAAVRTLAAENPHLRFGKPQERITEAGKKELLFGCSHCGAAIPPEHIEMALYGTQRLLTAERYPVTITLARPITARAAHWCFPDDGIFCCEKA